jgi:hypothetical protein
MKIRTIAIAAALSLTGSLAFAQTNVDPVPPTERPVVVPDGAGPKVVDPAGTIQNEQTTGLAPVVRPATPGVVPGARDKSRAGGEGVSDRPPGN